MVVDVGQTFSIASDALGVATAARVRAENRYTTWAQNRPGIGSGPGAQMGPPTQADTVTAGTMQADITAARRVEQAAQAAYTRAAQAVLLQNLRNAYPSNQG